MISTDGACICDGLVSCGFHRVRFTVLSLHAPPQIYTFAPKISCKAKRTGTRRKEEYLSSLTLSDATECGLFFLRQACSLRYRAFVFFRQGDWKLRDVWNSLTVPAATVHPKTLSVFSVDTKTCCKKCLDTHALSCTIVWTTTTTTIPL